MKKILCLLTAFLMLSSAVFAEVYDYPYTDKTDSAYFKPYYIAQNAKRYSPWVVNYCFETKEQLEAGEFAGSGGQIIMSIDMSPVDEDFMFLGTDVGGAFYSKDGGNTWNCHDGVLKYGVGDIQYHPSSKNLLYILECSRDSDTKLTASTGDGIYKSLDGGETFMQIFDKDILITTGSENIMDFDKDEYLYILACDGVYKSTSTRCGSFDRLVELNSNSSKNYCYCLSISENGKKIIATTDNGIDFSLDGGKTWSKMQMPQGQTKSTCTILNPDNETTVYGVFSGTYSGKTYSGGLYKTEDFGKSWEKMDYDRNNNGTNSPVYIKFSAKKADGTRNMYLVFTLMSYPLRISPDYGKTWYRPEINRGNQVLNTATGYYPEGLAVSYSNPNVLFYSFGDMVYKSTDGGKTFNMSCVGYEAINIEKTLFGADGRLWLPCTDKGLALTDTPYEKGKYPTLSMQYSTGLTKGTASSVLVNPNDTNDMLLYIGNWTDGDYYRTLDGGLSWEKVLNEKGEAVHGEITRNNAYYPEKNIIYTHSLTSYDFGKTWTENEFPIWSVSPVNKDVLYSMKNKEIYRSDDCGKTWNVVGTKLSSPYELVADKFDEKTCWIGSYDGTITKLTDTVKTTFGDGNGIEHKGISFAITTIEQDPKDKNHLIASGKSYQQAYVMPGIFETYNGGSKWEIITGFPGTRHISSITFSPVSSEVFMSSASGTYIYDYEAYQKCKNGTFDMSSLEPEFEDFKDGKIRVKLNGSLIFFDVEPFTLNDRTMVPMRKIFEKLGAKISWDNDTETVTAVYRDRKITLKVGDEKALINGEEKILDAPAIVKDDRTLVPLRFVAESLGADVNWSEENTLVKITLNQ